MLFSVLTDGALLQPQNISNIVVQNSYILILAIGMILIIIAGHIDLSVGLGGGGHRRDLGRADGRTWTCRGRWRCSSRSASGALIGAWQGYWIAYFGIPAFIVTLAGMLMFRALTLTVLGNQGIGPFPDAVRTLSNGFTAGYLGNVGLGPLGGADLFTLLVGLAAVAGIVAHAVAHPRGPARLRPGRRPVPAVRRARSSRAALVVMFVDRRSWPGSRTCRGCWCCSRCWSSATRC